MKIISLAFEHNARIPSKYTCDGENVNPPLEFSDVPENAKSLALGTILGVLGTVLRNLDKTSQE